MSDWRLADLLRDGVHNAGCEGVSRDVERACVALTMHERGKLAALLGRLGYENVSHLPLCSEREVLAHQPETCVACEAQPTGQDGRAAFCAAHREPRLE